MFCRENVLVLISGAERICAFYLFLREKMTKKKTLHRNLQIYNRKSVSNFLGNFPFQFYRLRTVNEKNIVGSVKNRSLTIIYTYHLGIMAYFELTTPVKKKVKKSAQSCRARMSIRSTR